MFEDEGLEGGAQESEENLTSDALIPCSFCCEMCKGIQL